MRNATGRGGVSELLNQTDFSSIPLESLQEIYKALSAVIQNSQVINNNYTVRLNELSVVIWQKKFHVNAAFVTGIDRRLGNDFIHNLINENTPVVQRYAALYNARLNGGFMQFLLSDHSQSSHFIRAVMRELPRDQALYAQIAGSRLRHFLPESNAPIAGIFAHQRGEEVLLQRLLVFMAEQRQRRQVEEQRKQQLREQHAQMPDVGVTVAMNKVAKIDNADTLLDNFRCPITGSLIQGEAVTLGDHPQYFDKNAVDQLLKSDPRHPLTREPITSNDVHTQPDYRAHFLGELKKLPEFNNDKVIQDLQKELGWESEAVASPSP